MTKFALQPLWMVLLVCLITAGSQSASAEIVWQSQLKTAHAQAQAEGKLLLLHFYDDNCVWCERLEKGAFQSPDVVAAIEKNYVPVKIHAGKNPSIASTFKVTRFPTDVIVTTQGQALSHSVSPQESGRYVAMLAQQSPQLTESNVAAAVAPAASPVAPTEAPSIQEVASIKPALPAQGVGFVMPNASTETPVTAISHRMDSNKELAPAPTAVTKSSPPTAELELAMDGFCAVTVIEKDRWVEGNPEFGVVHLGRLYLFSDKNSMDRFVANPEPYTPVLNGIDVVRFFEEKKIVQGNREWGLKDPDHNRMFFFADEAALNHFYNQHTRYTDASLAVMQKAVKDANPGK